LNTISFLILTLFSCQEIQDTQSEYVDRLDFVTIKSQLNQFYHSVNSINSYRTATKNQSDVFYEDYINRAKEEFIQIAEPSDEILKYTHEVFVPAFDEADYSLETGFDITQLNLDFVSEQERDIMTNLMDYIKNDKLNEFFTLVAETK